MTITHKYDTICLNKIHNNMSTNSDGKSILAFFNLKKPEDLLGKRLKISFTQNDTNDDKANGNLIPQNLFLLINSFTFENSQLAFSPIPLGQGNEFVQVSIFSKNEYHIVISDNKERQLGYFFSTKEHKSTGIIRGKISIV